MLPLRNTQVQAKAKDGSTPGRQHPRRLYYRERISGMDWKLLCICADYDYQHCAAVI